MHGHIDYRGHGSIQEAQPGPQTSHVPVCGPVRLLVMTLLRLGGQAGNQGYRAVLHPEDMEFFRRSF